MYTYNDTSNSIVNSKCNPYSVKMHENGYLLRKIIALHCHIRQYLSTVRSRPDDVECKTKSFETAGKCL